jgi:DNA-binding Lrp family transcriptional regulator
MRLSERCQKIVRAVQLQAQEPERSTARKLKLRPHTVRYEIRRAVQSGLLTRFVPVNVFALGLHQYQCYISFVHSGRDLTARLEKALAQSGCAAWFVTLAGRFQFGFALCVRNPEELYQVLDQVVRDVGERILDRQIVHATRMETYPVRYLDTSNTSTEHLQFDESSERAELDATDRAILALSLKFPDQSYERLGRLAGVSKSTFAARIDKMRRVGLVLPDAYDFSPQQAGILAFRVFISLIHDNDRILEAVLECVRSSPSIISINRVLGAWEYELSVEVTASNEIEQALSGIRDRLQGMVRDLEIVQVTAQKRVHSFLQRYLQ